MLIQSGAGPGRSKEEEQKDFMGLGGVKPFWASQKQNTKPDNGSDAPSGEATKEEKMQAAKDSWRILARRHGLPEPDDAKIVEAMKAGPTGAVTKIFGWAQTLVQKNQLVRQYYDILYSKINRNSAAEKVTKADEEIPPMATVVADAAPWISSLLEVEMSCGVVSFLERDVVDALLDYAGLSDLISPDKRVTASDGFSREGQQLLAAAIKVERRPDHCALFDATPGSVVEAREVEMKSVGMTGIYPAYELLAADTTARDFNFLTAMNIRRLFGEKESHEPQLMAEPIRPVPRRRVKTLFRDEDPQVGTKPSGDSARSEDEATKDKRKRLEETYGAPPGQESGDSGVRWEDDEFKDWLFQ
jgi:beta-phosphoglucomutase-like phosphatase (HAD superfamily)